MTRSLLVANAGPFAGDGVLSLEPRPQRACLNVCIDVTPTLPDASLRYLCTDADGPKEDAACPLARSAQFASSVFELSPMLF